MQHNIPPKPKTLSDCIVQLASHPKRSPVVEEQLVQIAERIVSLRKISWDQSVINAIDKTRDIQPEEVIAHLDCATYPFNSFWIEGPTFFEFSRHTPVKFIDKLPEDRKRELARLGAIVIASPKENKFKFIFVTEMLHQDILLADIRKGQSIQDLAYHFSDGSRPLCEFQEFVTVSSEEGVNLNENALFGTIESMRNKRHQDRSEYEKKLIDQENYDELIDDLSDMADFLSRFFLILGNPNFVNNFEEARLQQDKDLKERNTMNAKRLRDGKKALMPISPIKIDISEKAQANLNSGDLKKVRVLLGWTEVRRSKQMFGRVTGKPFFREAHKRRIEAPINRCGPDGPRREVIAGQHRQP